MFDHETVLKKEAVDALNIDPTGVYVDCTLGAGGHSEAIAEQLSTQGSLYSFDQDEQAIVAANKRLANVATDVHIKQENFRYFAKVLRAEGIVGVNGVLFDLGVSSPQLDEATRGFSYQTDARLDMRMNKQAQLTAHDVVNNWPYEQLVSIFYQYGEEKFAKPIARHIETAREHHVIETTFQLVDLIKEAIPAAARRKGGHPAKRVFQAIRITVNDELQAFEDALQSSLDLLNPGGRVCVITFHSLEDKICQKIFKEQSRMPDLPRGLPIVPEEQKPDFHRVTKKPIVPSEEEKEGNRRSRSARLRVLEKYNKQGG